MRPEPFLPRDLDFYDFLSELPPDWRKRAIESLGPEARDTYDRAWSEWAHEGQREPGEAPDWST